MPRRFTALILSWASLTVCIQQVGQAAPAVNEVGNFTASGNITAALYSS
jgi:hypothetical protein